MPILNFDSLDSLDEKKFQSTEPYPWINPVGALTDEGRRRLIETVPPIEQFERVFGKTRSYGQQSHDRLALEYHAGIELAEPWREFISELKGRRYGAFLRRMFGRRGLSLSFHWHYTPNGCSVSPHCDAAHKLGSHIFYVNSDEEWDPAWGGNTLVLDDSGRFDNKSAPAFEDFDREIASDTRGNRSFLFARRDTSWHGVRTIHCPEGRYRKVFIVVINDRLRAAGQQVWKHVRDFAGGRRDEANAAV
jgi:hypothetical protein